MFSALAFVVAYACQLIPKVADFLTPDVKDAIIAIAAFIYGPVVAPVISLTVAFLEFVTFSTTGPWGLLMNFTSSAVFSTVASLIYIRKKSFNSAIAGFSLAVVLTTAVMLALNPFIVPMYSGVPREAVISILPTVLLPFNFAKTLLNAAVSLLLYKPIISAMRSAGLVKKGKYKTEFNKSTVLSLVIGGAGLIISFVILIIIW